MIKLPDYKKVAYLQRDFVVSFSYLHNIYPLWQRYFHTFRHLSLPNNLSIDIIYIYECRVMGTTYCLDMQCAILSVHFVCIGRHGWRAD